MNKATHRNRPRWLMPVITLIIGLAVGVGATFALQENGLWTAALPPSASQQLSGQQASTEPGHKLTDQERYAAAVKDAVFAEKDEIMPLVSLTKEDTRVTWNEAGDRVLLLTWHNYPDSYPAGQQVTIDWGKVWTFAGKELQAKYNKEKDQVSDWDLRLKQIIGFPPDSKHSTVTGFWVRPQDVVRPAYQPNPTVGTMDTEFNKDVDPNFKTWFDGNIVWSYFDSAYPWTRLGYTYDWAGNGTKYGLSEFLVNQKAQVQVAFTESTDAFLQELSKSDARI